MKNKLHKILLIIAGIVLVIILLLALLGLVNRVGYLSDFKLNDNLSKNNEYHYDFRIRYYSKIFRNSDIYGVYIDTNEIINNNSFIKEIKMNDDKGTPFGNLISSKKLTDSEKIDNVSYKLKFKKIFFMAFILFFTAFFIYSAAYFNNKYLYFLYIILVCVFSIIIRLYWAYQQDGLFWDEIYSLCSANCHFFDISKIDNSLGEDILKNYFFNDATFKDAFNDIKSMYLNSRDPYITNLYYTFLRLSFLGREAYTYKDFIMTGTILNCVFFIIYFIFLYKLLRLIFKDDFLMILFLLLIISFYSYSIAFSMILRPYQMQEAFFIIILYLVLNTIINSLYQKKNFIITSIVVGIGYLTLYSYILYVLILSFMLFIYFIINKNKYITFANISKNTLIYYAASFILGFLVSQILYSQFIQSFFLQGDRSAKALKAPIYLFNQINIYAFNNILLYIIIISIFLFLFIFDKKLNMRDIFYKNNICIFIVLFGIIYSIVSDIIAPYYGPRYSASGYILIMFIIPILISIFSNVKSRLLIMIVLSLIYVYNVTDNRWKFDYFELTDMNSYVLRENIPVHSYNTFINNWQFNYLNTNLYYTYSKDMHMLEDNLNKNMPSEYYLIMRKNDINILTNNIFNNYKYEKLVEYTIDYSPNYVTIFKLSKMLE